jgi:hypothetical protein
MTKKKFDRFVPPFGQKNLTVMARGLIYLKIDRTFLVSPKPSHGYGIASLPRFGRKKLDCHGEGLLISKSIELQYCSVSDSSYSVCPLSDTVLLLPSFTPPNLGDGGLNRAVLDRTFLISPKPSHGCFTIGV